MDPRAVPLQYSPVPAAFPVAQSFAPAADQGFAAPIQPQYRYAQPQTYVPAFLPPAGQFSQPASSAFFAPQSAQYGPPAQPYYFTPYVVLFNLSTSPHAGTPGTLSSLHRCDAVVVSHCI